MDRIPLLIQLLNTQINEIDREYLQIPFFEYGLLNIIFLLANDNQEWFCQQEELFNTIRKLWNSDAFRNRYIVKKAYNEEEITGNPDILLTPKYEVPLLCIKIYLIFLRYFFFLNLFCSKLLNDNQDNHGISIDILYEVIFVFCHNYVSDLSFLKEFIDTEIIPKVNLKWRRSAFKKVANTFNEFKNDAGKNQHLARFMQYIVAPCFYYAFEHFDADNVINIFENSFQVVGSPPDPEQTNQENIISLCCTEISEYRDFLWCDTMSIVMFQFFVLLVQKCPAHIHDSTRKHQGNRLRLFMLFAWSCLHSPSLDLTVKYTGHLLIVCIIEKFNINRRIVLQVLSSLLTPTYHSDSKDVIRKSLEILIPAIPRRMDDGYAQLYTLIKKIIIEEGRNSPQISAHCL